ncbi:hypothetical protein RFI_35431 [Reticulomyxa filosa]|uniref:Uncharacterized protein n=1 Tax=Reticulomyxa filosa TaxID=46433 RepID=X6LJ92_RETFI|nr:hypothetical protein RFI_35431 [Reticulomyxa filosa]|eukprot:ETO02008.1 hypothetical protein RFI_35431 [Reticulomyxa filosa]
MYVCVCVGKYEWNWDAIGAILRNESAAVQNFVGTVSANEGDMYCFEGNCTMHVVAPIFGDKLRGVFVSPILFTVNMFINLNAWKEKSSKQGIETDTRQRKKTSKDVTLTNEEAIGSCESLLSPNVE